MNQRYINIDPDYYELVDEYVKEVSDQLQKMEEIILLGRNSMDYLSVKRIAHNIKGSAGSYGIHIVTELFQYFEEKIKEIENIGNLKLTDSLIDFLLKYIDISTVIFKRIADKNYDIGDLLEKIESSKLLSAESIETIQNEKQSINKQIKSDEPEKKQTHSETRVITRPSLKILLITESPLIYKMFLSALDDKTNTITMCENIAKSLMYIVRYKPDLIILNYVEESFSGSGLAAMLKLSFAFNHIKVIIISSKDDIDIKGSQYCDFIIKKDAKMYDKIAEIIRNL